jgi:hypothetical protein
MTCAQAPVRAADPGPPEAAPPAADGAAKPVTAAVETRPARPPAPIVLHQGIPGQVFLGQPLAEFIAAFPTAETSPFAGQADVVRLQVPDAGISALAMGLTPAVMTIESIGFNFHGVYEGVAASARRTTEGVGQGSTVNDLLGAYGRPAETAPEARRGMLAPSTAPDRNAPVRYLYRSADATIATYFVVEGTRVLRMAMSRPASVERWVLRRPDPGRPDPAGATPPPRPTPPPAAEPPRNPDPPPHPGTPPPAPTPDRSGPASRRPS